MLAIRPPMTAIANGCCIWAPGPKPKASGSKPKIVRQAGHQDRPEAGPAGVDQGLVQRLAGRRNWPMYSTRMMPFFTSSPMSKIAPMNDETFSGVPRDPQREQCAGQRHRLGEEDQQRQRQALNCKLSSRNTSAADTSNTVSRLANDSCCER